MRWWRRMQKSRSAGEVPLEVDPMVGEERPLHQDVARKAVHLKELGSTCCAIARKLGVDGKTVARAIRWLKMIGSQ